MAASKGHKKKITTPSKGSTKARPIFPIKLMLASTIYGFEDQLDQLVDVLSGYGYEVLNSHRGTVKTNSGNTNLEDCLTAVKECDVFVGLIRPFYGSGKVGERSITHEEMRLALTLDKPRWVLVHESVQFMRQILKRNAFKEPFVSTAAMDDLRVVELYEEMLQAKKPVAQRRGYWVQTYKSMGDVLRYLDTNLKNIEDVRRLCR